MKASKYILSSELAQLAILGQFDMSLTLPKEITTTKTFSVSQTFQPEFANMPIESIISGNSLWVGDRVYNDTGSVNLYTTSTLDPSSRIGVATVELGWKENKLTMSVTITASDGYRYTEQNHLRAFGYIFKSPFEP